MHWCIGVVMQWNKLCIITWTCIWCGCWTCLLGLNDRYIYLLDMMSTLAWCACVDTWCYCPMIICMYYLLPLNNMFECHDRWMLRLILGCYAMLIALDSC